MTFGKRALTASAAAALAVPLLVWPAGAAAGETPIPPPRPIDGFCLNPSPAPFTDVPASGDASAAELALAVRCLATADVAEGSPRDLGATRYGPELDVTRGQMASFVARMIDAAVAREVREPRVRELPAPAAGNPFADVSSGDPHRGSIQRLHQAGIVQGNPGTAQQPGGIGADRFGPKLSITRAQMASFLNRAVAYLEGGEVPQAGSSPAHGFSSPEDADYYGDALQQLHARNIEGITSAGIAQGVGGDRYDSLGTVTRRQMARFVARTLAAVNLPVGDQRILTLRESLSASFSDADRDVATRTTAAGAPGEGTAVTDADSRSFTATGLAPGVEYRITLVRAGQIERAAESAQVRFSTEPLDGGSAVDPGAPASRVVSVNGGAPRTQGAAGTAPTATGPTPSAVTEADADGRISFTVQSDQVEQVVPVLHLNGGGDQRSLQTGGGDSPRLQTDAEGRPLEFFGLAGQTDVVADGSPDPEPSQQPDEQGPRIVEARVATENTDADGASGTASPGDVFVLTLDEPLAEEPPERVGLALADQEREVFSVECGPDPSNNGDDVSAADCSVDDTGTVFTVELLEAPEGGAELPFPLDIIATVGLQDESGNGINFEGSPDTVVDVDGDTVFIDE